MKKTNNQVLLQVKIVAFIVWVSLSACSGPHKEKGTIENNTDHTAKAPPDQPTERNYRVYMDISHGQKFWNNPNDMVKTAGNNYERVKWMTSQIQNTASSVDASVGYFNSGITAEGLTDCDLLFIHIPSTQYSEEEVSSIIKFVEDGGSLFLVMDEDYWTNLTKTNVNDIIKPFDIQFGGNSPDKKSGGHTKAGVITNESMKVNCHGTRTLTGGTAFCFQDQSEEAFGVYKELENGGKMVVMGDGMASLYMTEWDGVKGYPSHEFMQMVFQWLLG
ncbi:MAG: GldG family protein [Cyclobacteriaceae bacterium]|nr:GldG family protein [Cyclobacteriaceae bacterium]